MQTDKPQYEMTEEVKKFYQKCADEGNPYANIMVVQEYMKDHSIDDLKKDEKMKKRVETCLPLPEANYLMYAVTSEEKYLVAAQKANYTKALLLAAKNMINNPDTFGKALEYFNDCRKDPETQHESCAFLIRYYINRREYQKAYYIFSDMTFNYSNDNELLKLSGILDVMRERFDSGRFNYLFNNTEDIECKFFTALYKLWSKKEPEPMAALKDSDEEVIIFGNVGSSSRLILARAYKQGKGVTKDLNKAIEWYLQAKDKGFNDYIEIADVYEELKDYEKSFEWYNTAAEEGNVTALVMLGKKLMYGEHIDKDLDMARLWLEQAVDLGSSEAERLLRNKAFTEE